MELVSKRILNCFSRLFLFLEPALIRRNYLARAVSFDGWIIFDRLQSFEESDRGWIDGKKSRRWRRRKGFPGEKNGTGEETLIGTSTVCEATASHGTAETSDCPPRKRMPLEYHSSFETTTRSIFSFAACYAAPDPSSLSCFSTQAPPCRGTINTFVDVNAIACIVITVENGMIAVTHKIASIFGN